MAIRRDKKVGVIIFLLIAFGINILLEIPFIHNKHISRLFFTEIMMISPAAGAYISGIYSKEKVNNNLTRNCMLGLYFLYLIMLVLVMGGLKEKIAEEVGSIATMAVSCVIMISVLKKRDGKGIFYQCGVVRRDIIFFIAVLVAKALVDLLPYFNEYGGTAIFEISYSIIVIPFLFFFNSARYYGEEYGWRGFLQDKMQKRLGKKTGVILLGIVWEAWHMPLWFSIYKLEKWEIPLRFLLAISIAIFIGYLYMKTQNVWICSLAHCIFDVISGSVGSGMVIENKYSLFHTVTLVIFCIIVAAYIFKNEYASISK